LFEMISYRFSGGRGGSRGATRSLASVTRKSASAGHCDRHAEPRASASQARGLAQTEISEGRAVREEPR
jgi:hypothetical protein